MPGAEKWSDIMKRIMLNKSAARRPHLKNEKEITEYLKTHSRDALSYDYYHQLLESSAQNND